DSPRPALANIHRRWRPLDVDDCHVPAVLRPHIASISSRAVAFVVTLRAVPRDCNQMPARVVLLGAPRKPETTMSRLRRNFGSMILGGAIAIGGCQSREPVPT